MSVCDACKKEMSCADVTACGARGHIEYPDGTVLQAVPYDPGRLSFPKWFRCPDCNVAPGGAHHPYCDQEICPRCGGQFVACDCFTD
ncbi:MAG: hypothetical protein LBJ21_05590 [Acidobacteriota bacterium]|nr:hypothetical protein [Acidobacteriota bacterium]